MSLAEHPDRLRWNARYGPGYTASFAPHPLAAQALSMELPEGPVADLACGPSGSALLAAAGGRKVTAVDISEIALRLLDREARRRGLRHLITVRHADLGRLHLPPRHFALVLCTGFWGKGFFTGAAESVALGGLLAWEAFTVEALRARPALCADWCLAPGEPASLLPPGFEVVDVRDLPAPVPSDEPASRPRPPAPVLSHEPARAVVAGPSDPRSSAPVPSHEPARAVRAGPSRPRRHNEQGAKRRLLARRVATPGQASG